MSLDNCSNHVTPLGETQYVLNVPMANFAMEVLLDTHAQFAMLILSSISF